MFNKMSLRSKILSVCGLLVGFVALNGGLSYIALDRVTANYEHIAYVNFTSNEHLGRMFLSYRKLRIQLRTLGLQGLTKEWADKSVNEVQQAIKEYEEADEAYRKVEFAEGEKELYEKVADEWKEFKTVALHVLDLHKANTPAARAEMTSIFFNQCPKSAERYTANMNKLLAFQEEQAKSWAETADTGERWTKGLIIFILLAATAVGAAVALFLAGSLSKTLRSIAHSISAGADEVAEASTEVSAASESLSAAATEQASALQETASSIEEMSAMVRKNAENAERSRTIAAGGHDSATKGKEVVGQMITAINEINTSNAEIMQQIEVSNQKMGDIVKVIMEIGNKTKVINDIVFQTKLLSFNASVEAARAGEHGKGFAVVAEEVGNLAQMSGNAAREISGMLNDSIQKVEGIVTETKTKVGSLVASGKAKVEAGTTIARKCGEVLDQLVGDVGSVNQMVTEISSATQEQSQGVQEITKAMQQLDQVTQQNATASHQAAAASGQMARQAELLRAGVHDLLRAVNGNHGQVHSAHSVSGDVTKAPVAPSEAHKDKVIDLKGAKLRKKSQPAPEAGFKNHVAEEAKPASSALKNIPSETDARFKDV